MKEKSDKEQPQETTEKKKKKEEPSKSVLSAGWTIQKSIAPNCSISKPSNGNIFFTYTETVVEDGYTVFIRSSLCFWAILLLFLFIFL